MDEFDAEVMSEEIASLGGVERRAKAVDADDT